MRRVFALCSVLCVCAYAGDSAYQPLAVGNRWEYSVTGPDGAKSKMSSRIADKRKLNNQDAFEMSLVVGKDESKSLFLWTNRGLIQAESSLLKFNPPFLEIKSPVKAGAKWDWTGTVTIGGIQYPATAHLALSGPMKVKVAAGTFSAMTISRTVNVKTGDKTMTVTSTDWYAKDVGWVKGTMDQGGRKSFTELISYKVAK